MRSIWVWNQFKTHSSHTEKTGEEKTSSKFQIDKNLLVSPNEMNKKNGKKINYKEKRKKDTDTDTERNTE
jgi:hypothetical protein